MIRNCDLCSRKLGKITHMAFIPLKEILYCPHVLGIHLGLCLECELSYLAQYFESNSKDIDEYIKWTESNLKYAPNTNP